MPDEFLHSLHAFQDLEEQIDKLNDEILSKKKENENLLQRLEEKDNIFNNYREQHANISKGLNQKEKENL